MRSLRVLILYKEEHKNSSITILASWYHKEKEKKKKTQDLVVYLFFLFFHFHKDCIIPKQFCDFLEKNKI